MKSDKDLLTLHHLKITPGRLAVLHALEVANAPIDSGDIFTYVQKSGVKIDRATIFRALHTFKKIGILRAIQLNESKFRYELTSLPEHHHIICKICGKIADVNVCIDKQMEQEIKEQTHFVIDTHMLEFTGICPDCLSAHTSYSPTG